MSVPECRACHGHLPSGHAGRPRAYCGEKCALEWRRRQELKKYKSRPRKPRTCDVCKNKFQPENNTQKRCSVKCKDLGQERWVEEYRKAQAKLAGRRVSAPEKRRCEECREIFVTKHRGKRFCDEDCRTKAQTRRSAERTALLKRSWVPATADTPASRAALAAGHAYRVESSSPPESPRFYEVGGTDD